MLSVTEEIINKIEVLYDRVATSLKSSYDNDIYQTCSAIKKYKEYRAEIQAFDRQKSYNNTGKIK